MPDDRRPRRAPRRAFGFERGAPPPAWLVDEMRDVMARLVEDGHSVTQAATGVGLALARVLGELTRAHLGLDS